MNIGEPITGRVKWPSRIAGMDMVRSVSIVSVRSSLKKARPFGQVIVFDQCRETEKPLFNHNERTDLAETARMGYANPDAAAKAVRTAMPR